MRKRFSGVLSLALAALLATAGSVPAQQGRTSKLPANTNTSERAGGDRSIVVRNGRMRSEGTSNIAEDFSEALTVIQDNHADGKQIDYNTVYKSSINGMLRALDPHSNYFDRAAFEEFLTEQRSQYFGIGAVIEDLRYGDKLDTYFRATFQNSPAARAGLRFGDRIVEVNGESMRGKPYYEVREHLRGPRGSSVKVTIERAATGRTEVVEITRDAVPQPSIPEAYMVRPGVGYIALTGGFNTTTAEEFRVALESLHAQGMNTLVLDLRSNGGGLLSQAVRVANTFLHSGQLILTQKGRVRGSSQSYVAENDSPDQTPIVILVNRGTASASEIVAGALQDHDRALIVGETSFGKGLVQLPFDLDHGSALLLTIAKYYTPSGRLIQRDYTSNGFYDYYTQGGISRQDEQAKSATQEKRPAGPESRTDTGRVVYGGGGISPDEVVKPNVISPAQQRFIDPIFAFAMELTNGRLNGFDAYIVQRPIEYGHDLKATDFPVTEALYKALKDFVATKPAFKISAAQLDRERAFVERQLRYELATAAYGTTTAVQVFNISDPQIGRAIDLMPRARELARAARRARFPS
ncbi:MAG TPA: S41 family peptidase [Pyrinomonadaceae bacterium]|jgi:carboxyl-terminal processing protease|nr:S41 family peptidase [Pyrinomonadaceae bacterium]